MATELKPCPFCGGTDIRKLTTILDCDIFCCNCRATIHRTNFIVGNALAETLVDAEPEAIKAWNKRVKQEPCDVCRFYPPSSMDGKPCTMCVAYKREEDA